LAAIGIGTAFDLGKDEVIGRFQPTSRIIVESFILLIPIKSLNEPHDERDDAIEHPSLPLEARTPMFLVHGKALPP
jgi:hypothetical protein